MNDAQIWTVIGALYVFPVAMYFAARWLDRRFRTAEERIFGRSEQPRTQATTASGATSHAQPTEGDG